MIIESVGRRVGGRCIGRSVGKWSVVGWSVVGGFNKPVFLGEYQISQVNK